jgi:hypothetical protein
MMLLSLLLLFAVVPDAMKLQYLAMSHIWRVEVNSSSGAKRFPEVNRIGSSRSRQLRLLWILHWYKHRRLEL